jgi:Zn-dependent protease
MPTRQGSIRLFQFAGVTVYLHWSWFLVALYAFEARAQRYTSYFWCVLEVLALFAIVLMHEFGHALACRSVGGKAEEIVLWPLGGVAYVAPPQRPGAMLWSIAAGPLVNVVLAPVLLLLVYFANAAGWAATMPNASVFIHALWDIDIILLVFNLLPVYPLDGGQILQSLLWFVVGRARSLFISTIIGFVGVVGLIGLALLAGDWWLGILAVFILMNCWRGLKQARMLGRLAKLPRRAGFACPDCKQPPVRGPIWRCMRCLKPFDMFEAQAMCPHCGQQYPVIPCLDCGSPHSLNDWVAVPPLPTVMVSPPVMPGAEAER